MKKKLIIVLITSLLLILMIPSVALAVDETADFNGLSYSNDAKILPIDTSINGFVFTGTTSGADVGMRYSTNLGQEGSAGVYADYDNGSVPELIIKRDDGSDFKLKSIWLDAGGFGSYEVKIEGYNNDSLVSGCTKLNIDITSAVTVSLDWVDPIDEFRITATDQENGSYDVAATIDNIVYELPPTVDTNTGLTLNEGATATINNTHLSSSDDNDGATDITYTITDIPDNGVLKRDGSTLTLNGTFTQTDIDSDLITYVHDGTNTTSDSFTFKVANSAGYELTGQTFSITVNAVDDDTPTIVTNNGLPDYPLTSFWRLYEGGTMSISIDHLEANDTDTDNATLTYTITSSPSNGQVENTDNTGVAITTFTQQNLIDGKIQYVHGDGNNTSDSFTFKVADGTPNELTGQTFNITITPVDDDVPTISINNGYPDPGGPTDPLLYEGGTCSISDEHLEAQDTDSDDATLIFTITSAPSNGQVENTDNPGNAISSFTQQDIIDGKIQYVHDGSNTTSDSLTFKVADGTPNELTGQTFNFTITAVDDDTPTIVTNNGLPDYPSFSPDPLYTGNTMCIPIDLLEADDTDTDNATLTFIITSSTNNGRVENSDNPGVPISSFTQQNLIDSKIQYVHDGGTSSSDSFTFKVTDGTNEITGQTFSITITVSVSSVVFDNSEVTMNTGVTSALNTTFPYTITPSNAANKDVTFTSSNPAVATVDNSTGMVTALAPGITKITVASDFNLAIEDECILKVADPTPPPVGAKGGTIGGKLVDNSGNPLVGYRVTLCSTPVTVITNSLGEFQFPTTTFSNHILIINDPAMHEITRFALGFTQGASTNATIDNMANTIAITYANRTATINVDLQSNLAGDDIAANDVVFVSNAVAYADVKVENPETGDDSIPYGGLVVNALIILLALVGLMMVERRAKQTL